MRARILWFAAGLVLFLCLLGAYVAVAAGPDLYAARAALSGSPESLGGDRIRSARRHLADALTVLDSVPARILGALPVAGQNLGAVRSVAAATIPVLDTTSTLHDDLQSMEKSGLLRRGAVRLDLIGQLRAPLAREERALGALASELAEQRTGWLLPPLWHQLDVQLERARELHAGARHAVEAAGLVPDLLGRGGSRTYLVLILNNAEQRGAGGILSGVGTVSVRDGRIELGRFQHYKDLADEPPYRSVPAPPDFQRHFKAYDAATTRWVATSSSPDVPDVAVVASRLFRLVRGVRTDGALVIDPRGLQALMPPHATVNVPGSNTTLRRDEIASYVYSKAYSELASDQTARRDALIGVGQAAFRSILDGGFGGSSVLSDAGDAVAGGHLRFVSFHAAEETVLQSLGVTGNLGRPASDGALVTVQNFGGNKLDYWAKRTVDHACKVVDATTAECLTSVSIANHVPGGLPRFVYQYRPYGLFKDFVELYVPSGAALQSVELDGQPARVVQAPEDGYSAVGVYVELPRGQTSRIALRYRLRLRGRYSLDLLSQPLAHDAAAHVALDLPSSWEVQGPGAITDGVLRYSGPLDRRLEWSAGPAQETGIPGVWAALGRFWSRPLF